MNIDLIITELCHYDFDSRFIGYVSSWLNQNAQSFDEIGTSQGVVKPENLGFYLKSIGLRFNQSKDRVGIILTYFNYSDVSENEALEPQRIQVTLVFTEQEPCFVEKTILRDAKPNNEKTNGFVRRPSRVKYKDYEPGHNPGITIHCMTDVTRLGYHWVLIENPIARNFEVMEFLDYELTDIHSFTSLDDSYKYVAKLYCDH